MAKNSKYKAALVDMDGVLYDTMKYHTLAWHHMISELGIPYSREEFYRYEGMTGKATINLIFQRTYNRNATEEEIKNLYARKSLYFEQYGRKEKIAYVHEILTTFKNAGMRVILVTGSGQKSILDTINNDFPGIFDDKVTAFDVVHGKPHPEPYLMGAAKACVVPEECIALENAPLGCKSAHEAGCFTLGVTTGPLSEDELISHGADIVFPSMKQLYNALDRII